jgi:hypothetical protein
MCTSPIAGHMAGNLRTCGLVRTALTKLFVGLERISPVRGRRHLPLGVFEHLDAKTISLGNY